MKYIIDVHAKPPCVVLVAEDPELIREVGQRYADQVGRDLVVAVGPRSDEPDIRPTIAQAPELKLELVTTPVAVELEGEARRLKETLSKAQRDALAAFLTS